MACDGQITVGAMTEKSLLQARGIVADSSISDEAEDNANLGEDYPFRFCTEAAITLGKEGSGKEVEAFFQQYQSEGKCDSMAAVYTDALFKVYSTALYTTLYCVHGRTVQAARAYE
jgi:hypothetical protein